MAWLTATYLIDSAPEQIEARAQALAIEQSVECPLEAVHDPRILENVVARVESIERHDDARFRVGVRIAVATTGGETAQLINMVFGNCSLWRTCSWSTSTFRRRCWRAFRDRVTGSRGFARCSMRRAARSPARR